MPWSKPSEPHLKVVHRVEPKNIVHTLNERTIFYCSTSRPHLRIGLRCRRMNDPKPHSPKPDAIRKARLVVGLTQTEAAHVVQASLRGWQQWEAGDRAMPPGLFELFMLKTGQWPLDGKTEH